MDIQLKNPMTFEDAERFLSNQSIQEVARRDHISWSLKVSVEYSILLIQRSERTPEAPVPVSIASFLLELARRVRDVALSGSINGIEKPRPKLTLVSSK
ncbi:MAG: hypothetical protein AAB552_04145 [Patescibacteria group bacterium]